MITQQLGKTGAAPAVVRADSILHKCVEITARDCYRLTETQRLVTQQDHDPDWKLFSPWII